MKNFQLDFFLEVFPKHIYIGVIGGIGTYLLEPTINNLIPNLFDYQTFFHYKYSLLQILALVLALLLFVFDRNKDKSNRIQKISLSFLIVSLAFYVIAYFKDFSLEYLAKNEWLFPLPDNQITIREFYSDFGKYNKQLCKYAYIYI